MVSKPVEQLHGIPLPFRLVHTSSLLSTNSSYQWMASINSLVVITVCRVFVGVCMSKFTFFSLQILCEAAFNIKTDLLLTNKNRIRHIIIWNTVMVSALQISYLWDAKNISKFKPDVF